MFTIRSQFAVILAVAGSLSFPAGSWAQNPQAQEQATAKALAELPTALADVPLGQVVVTYRNGELTIKARNAPLVDILRAVCSQIGAVLDFSSERTDPILAAVGPAPAKEVLASLLHDAHFNYAMAESPDDPNALASVIVFPKTKDSKTLGLVARDGVSPGQVNSTTATTTESRTDTKQQMRELLTQARAELASSGGILLGPQGGDENGGDAGSGAQKVDAAAILDQVEAQIGAIGDNAASGADSPQTGPPPGTAAPVMPDGRPRHRRKH